MPWTAEDAESHTKKADSPKRQRMWAEIANSVLAETGDEGRAIRDSECSGRQRLRQNPQSLIGDSVDS